MDTRDRPLAGWRRGVVEFLYFGVKEARAGLFGMPRYDLLLLIALAIQAWRLLELRVRHHPPYWMAGLVAAAIYLNFFTRVCGVIRTSWARGRRYVSANGAPGRYWSS